MTPSAFTVVNSIAAMLLWGALIAFSRAMISKSVRDRHAALLSRFIIFFALAVTLTIRWPYQFIDRLAGVNNLAWLISYLSLVSALHAAVQITYLPHSRDVPLWIKALYPVTTGGLIGIFVLGIAATPSYPDHGLARSEHELLFMCLLFSYAALMGSMIATYFWRVARDEQIPYLRIRARLAALAAGSGALCMLAKLCYTLIGFYWPTTKLLPVLWVVVWVCFVSAPALLLLSYLSRKPLERITSEVERFQMVQALLELEVLRGQLERYCPPLATSSPPASWRDKLADPHYYLYRTIIYLFDCQHMLTKHFSDPQALHLYNLLKTLPAQSESFALHVAQARLISKRLKYDGAN